MQQKFDSKSYETISSLEQLDGYIAAAFEAGAIAIDTETSSLQSMQAELVGISFASRRGAPATSRCATGAKAAAIFSAATISCPANCRKQKCSRG